ncbi:MAG: tetratricopeptide repeat protein [Prevotella sp.]|nr:tetratricopeptide repeat protein [Prevotella sp.]
MRRHLLYIILAILSTTAYAQADRQHIRGGNRLYRAKQWAQAEVEYRKALASNAQNPQALYNLGCALMMQQKDSAAIVQYQKAAQAETNKLRRSRSYHNIGVICQNLKMYGDAIKVYQQSLRDNPKDDETRYNLALCKRQNKQNQQNQDKQQNKDQNKEQDKKDQQDKQQNKNNDQKQDKQQEQNDKMSKENAEQLLNAAIQNEKATQQRLKKAMQQPQRRNIQKNW